MTVITATIVVATGGLRPIVGGFCVFGRYAAPAALALIMLVAFAPEERAGRGGRTEPVIAGTGEGVPVFVIHGIIVAGILVPSEWLRGT